MDTENLNQILREEMLAYTGQGLNAMSYLTENAAQRLYTVVDMATVQGQRMVNTVLIAWVQGEYIVIELDQNNKELADALIARGVPADQIVLAYQGDAIPAEHA